MEKESGVSCCPGVAEWRPRAWLRKGGAVRSVWRRSKHCSLQCQCSSFQRRKRSWWNTENILKESLYRSSFCQVVLLCSSLSTSCPENDGSSQVVLQQLSLETVGAILEPLDYWEFIVATLGDTEAVRTVHEMDFIKTGMGKVRVNNRVPSFRVETSCSIKRLLEDEELCCWL